MTRFIVDHDRQGAGRPLGERREGIARALAYWRGIAQAEGRDLQEAVWQSPDGRTLIGTLQRGGHAAQPSRFEDGSILIGDLGCQIEDRPAVPQDVAAAFRSPDGTSLGALDGGWAAVMVTPDGSLCAARDRFGLKPLYAAALSDGQLILASNAGAIVKSGRLRAEANPDFLVRYAGYHYRGTYGDRPSAFKRVELLDPAQLHCWTRDGYRQHVYWDLDAAAPYDSADEEEIARRYRDTLLRMTEHYLRPRSGERLAVALSGGIDSGSIVGLLHEVTGERVEAISMTYHEATQFDESDLIAASVHDHVDRWHDVKIDHGILLDDLPTLYDRFDLPLATVSIYGYDYLYREAAKRGMSTIFTGSGGDYIQAGNYTCFLYHLADLKISDPERYREELDWWITHHGTAAFAKTPETAESFFREALDLDRPGQLLGLVRPLADGVVSGDFAAQAHSLAGRTVGNYGDYTRSYVMQEYLFEAVAPGSEAEDLIDWTWGTAMTSPFFCRDVVEFGWRLPHDQRIRKGVNKVLARRALRGICADEILDRVDKSGFNAPFDQWIRGPLKPFTLDVFGSQKFRERGIYDKRKFERLLDDHMEGRASHMMLLWQALNMELWMRSWIDG